MSLKASKPGSKRENSKRRSTAATYLLDLLFPFSIPQVSPNSDDLDHPIPRIERSRRKELHISNTPVPGDQHSFFFCLLIPPTCIPFLFSVFVLSPVSCLSLPTPNSVTSVCVHTRFNEGGLGHRGGPRRPYFFFRLSQ